MRKLEEIKHDIRNLIIECPGICEEEISKQLKISQRMLKKFLDQMSYTGEICLN